MAPEKGQRLDQVAGGKYMLPNLLVNPGFEVWQRGAGPFTCALASGTFSADEWQANLVSGGNAGTISRNSSPKFGSYCLDLTVTSGMAYAAQGVEAWKSLEGAYITFGVWAKTSVADKAYLQIADDKSGVEVTTSAYHTGGGDWERLVATKLIRTGLIPAGSPYPHDFPLRLSLVMSDVGSVQFDGAVAVAAEVPFPEGVAYAPPNPGDDWKRCERFFQKIGTGGAALVSMGGNPTNDWYNIEHFFPTRMYGVPTITNIYKYVTLYKNPSLGSGSLVDTANWTVGGVYPYVNGFTEVGTKSTHQTTYDVAYVSNQFTAEVT